MKIVILLIRILGVAAALCVLAGLGYMLMGTYLPLLAVDDEKIRSALWQSLFTGVLPVVVICVALLLPYRSLPSFVVWRLAYGVLWVGTIYLAVVSVVDALRSSDTALSLEVSAIPFCILLSQLSVILVDRVRRARTGDS